MADGYNNIDQAVVFPKSDYAEIEERMYQRQQQRRREEELRAAKDQQRQDSLVKMVGGEFENKDFMTGTAADPDINNDLAAMKQKYIGMIQRNPNASMADLYMQMQKDIGNVASKSSYYKAANSAITDLTKDFDKAKGIDGGAIRKLAFSNILYITDPKTGQKRKRTSEELAAVNPQEEVDKIIKQHPEMYLDEGTAMQSKLNAYKPYQTGNEFKTEQAGVTKRNSYDATLYPFQEIVRDNKGREVLDATGKAQYQLRAKPAEIDGQPVVLNGKPIKVMDDEVYQEWVGDRANNAILIKDLNDFNRKSGKPPIEDGTPEADILKSHFLYNRLQGVRPLKFETKDLTDKDAYRSKREQGWNPASVASATASAVTKALKETQALQGTDFGTLLRGAALEPTILEGTTKKNINGNDMYDITGSVGGIVLGVEKPDPTDPLKERRKITGNVYIDPTKPGAITVTDPNGKATEYKDKELRKFLKNVAGYNGTTIDKVDKILNLNVDSEGKFKNINPETKIAMGAEAKIAETQKKKFVAQATDAIEEYSKSGATNYLDPFIGKTGKIDGKSATITNIELAPGIFTDDIIVTYTGPDGTLNTEKINRPKSSGKMKQFLENFIK